ncbi:uncharacterized protein LOC130558392 [Triplophysa rosa]|uniref:uncharacterized protein LOC130558392 n=1 Tax=Triplophysa rosa TaxID=992332 RepID=UPI002545CCC8|nr:uncharacterized protein LOC130558392 [Triplophysa rosa]
MKRSFSLSRNKVVPLHTDLEESDPSGLETSDPQHQVDMQTGSSALEKKKRFSPCFRKRWWALKRNNKVKTPPKQSDLNPSDHQPVPEGPANQQQTKEKKKRVLGGVWQAIKRIFSNSWNSEVVPFPTQSDLDPSDPQPGPFEQPYRRVFKPAVLQDPADLGRGCCDREQTPLEDRSGVQPAAPREPADSQRSRQISFLYKMGKMIGEGNFGKVYKGTRRSERLKVAIKFIQETPRTNKYVKIVS